MGVPFILVGTKKDLRNNNEWVQRLKTEGKEPITPESGEELAKQVGAMKYVECSALTQEGQKRIFDEAITIAMANKERGKKPATKKKVCCGIALLRAPPDAPALTSAAALSAKLDAPRFAPLCVQGGCTLL